MKKTATGRNVGGGRKGIRHGSLDCSIKWRLLPADILLGEILPWLSVRSLLRFRCVCKSWRALISSDAFADSHLRRARERPTLLVTALVPGAGREKISMYRYDDCKFVLDHDIPWPLGVMWRPQHSNGLTLFNDAVGSELYNPSTRDYTPLPKGSRSARSWPRNNTNYGFLYGMNRIGFGFVASINAYKAGQYFYRSYNDVSGTWSMGFEVFTLGVDSSWRSTKEELLYPVDGSPPMSAGESIYFRIDRNLDTKLPHELRIFSFGLADEKFRLVSLPSDVPNHQTPFFAELAGSTCFYTLSIGKIKFDLWVASADKDKWTHVFNISLSEPCRAMYPVGMRHGRLLLCKIDNKCKYSLVRYSPKSESFETEAEFDLGEDFVCCNPQQCKRRRVRRYSPPRLTPYVEMIPYIDSLV